MVIDYNIVNAPSKNDDHVLNNGKKQVCRGGKKCIHDEVDNVKRKKGERKCCYTKRKGGLLVSLVLVVVCVRER